MIPGMSNGLRRAIAWLVLIALACFLVAILRAQAVPGALLLGPMAAAIVIAIAGLPARLPRFFIVVAQAVLGCLIAAAINDELTKVVAVHWETLAVFSAMTIVVTAVLGSAITRAGWLPGTTAIWGLSPSAAAAMVLLADEHGADKRIVAVMQYSRIVLVASAAIVLAKAVGHPISTGPAPAGSSVMANWLEFPPLPSFVQTLALAASGIAVAIFFRKGSLALFVPAFAGAALQAAGIIHIAVPPLLAALAFAVVGIYVGLSFTREALVHSLRAAPTIVTAVLVMIALCGLLSIIFSKLIPGTDPLTAYLALSPGGIDAAVIIATQMHVSLPLILATQFTRLLLVMASAPSLAKWLANRHQRRAESD